MKIVRELSEEDRRLLMDEYKSHPLFGTHVSLVITAGRSFIANLEPSDYKKIYICANLPNRVDPYQTIYEVVKYIDEHPEFLYQSASFHPSKQWYSGRLSGVMVSRYLRYFAQSSNISSIGGCFVLDTRGRGEVMDGMHRLTAFGLATHFNKRRFPVQVYFGANKPIDEIEYVR